MYLDSAYIAKFYLTEPDSDRVRAAMQSARKRISSVWAVGEVICAFHRHKREARLSRTECAEHVHTFLQHVDADIWNLAPVTDRLMRKMAMAVAALPPDVFIRTGDALHLTTASDLEEPEIWTSDRHVLAAAPYFGLIGRSA